MSTQTTYLDPDQESQREQPPKPIRVIALVDGFNLYHAIDWFDRGADFAEKTKYRKYKWLCLTSLVSPFVDTPKEKLEKLYYFTTYPNWDPPKEFRHKRYVMAQQSRGVEPVFGEFKETIEICKSCQHDFVVRTEKQTDVNIATMIVGLAHDDRYDKLILVTGDSDQVPALKLVRQIYPAKQLCSLIPIGRGSKEICRICTTNYTMTEQHLKNSKLPPIVKWASQGISIKKPDEYE